MKTDPHYQQQKCRPVILVYGDIRFMLIFVEVLWGGRQMTLGLSTTAIIFSISLAISSETLEISQHYYIEVSIRTADRRNNSFAIRMARDTVRVSS